MHKMPLVRNFLMAASIAATAAPVQAQEKAQAPLVKEGDFVAIVSPNSPFSTINMEFVLCAEGTSGKIDQDCAKEVRTTMASRDPAMKALYAKLALGALYLSNPTESCSRAMMAYSNDPARYPLRNALEACQPR